MNVVFLADKSKLVNDIDTLKQSVAGETYSSNRRVISVTTVKGRQTIMTN